MWPNQRIFTSNIVDVRQYTYMVSTIQIVAKYVECPLAVHWNLSTCTVSLYQHLPFPTSLGIPFRPCQVFQSCNIEIRKEPWDEARYSHGVRLPLSTRRRDQPHTVITYKHDTLLGMALVLVKLCTILWKISPMARILYYDKNFAKHARYLTERRKLFTRWKLSCIGESPSIQV